MENKVIRPKSRASALTKKVRQTDWQTIFFSKRHLKWLFTPQSFSLPFRDIQTLWKTFKRVLWRTDGRTDGRMDGPTEKWFIESRLKIFIHKAPFEDITMAMRWLHSEQLWNITNWTITLLVPEAKHAASTATALTSLAEFVEKYLLAQLGLFFVNRAWCR